MAKSRRTEKQKLQKDYEAFLEDERLEEERLQREDDEFWAQLMMEEERYWAEMEEREEAQERELLEHQSSYNSDYYPDFVPCF